MLFFFFDAIVTTGTLTAARDLTFADKLTYPTKNVKNKISRKAQLYLAPNLLCDKYSDGKSVQ